MAATTNLNNECRNCFKTFSRPDSLRRHEKGGCPGELRLGRVQDNMMFQEMRNTTNLSEVILAEANDIEEICAEDNASEQSDFNQDRSVPWYVPDQLMVHKWHSQFSQTSEKVEVFSPFKNYLDEVIFHHLYSRSIPMSLKEKKSLLSLIINILNFSYDRLNVKDRLLPSSLQALEKYRSTFQVSHVVDIVQRVRERGRDKGKMFPAQTVRLPSDIISQTLLCPAKSKGMIRVFPRAPSHLADCEESPSILSSLSIHEHGRVSTQCIEVTHISKEKLLWLYLGDEVVWDDCDVSFRGCVTSIYLKSSEATLRIDNTVEILCSRITKIIARPDGSGRKILREAGLGETTIEIVSVPLMIFSDDMNAGRSKTFSKMDNTVLILPSVPDLVKETKSRHHLGSSKSASLEEQLQPILEDIRRLQKGAVMFDAYKKAIVLVVADLIAFLADNPRANDICGQVQKQCR